MEIIAYIMLSLFIVSSGIHLFFAFQENEKWRKNTKVLPLFFLALSALFLRFTHPLIYIGATFGMIGDYFLIKNKEKKPFLEGAIFFLLGHILYISEVLFVILKNNPPSNIFYIVAGILLIILTLGAFPLSYKISKDRHIALIGNLYLYILLFVTAVSIVATSKGNFPFMMLGIFGGIFFLVSDLILTQATFVQDFKRRDFYIMLFYLLGQVLIVLSLIYSTTL